MAAGGTSDKDRFALLDLAGITQLSTVRSRKGPSVEQEFFDRAVAAAWMAHSQGKGSSAPAIHTEDPELPIPLLQQLLATKRFRRALADRGIPDPDLSHLSDDMVAALHILADPSLNLPPRKRLAKLGISWQTYQGWLNYRPFRAMYEQLMRNTLATAVATGDMVLAQRIEGGDLNAIKYANEMTGKFVPGQQQTVSVAMVVGMVLSSLKRRITDPDLLNELYDELLTLATGAGVPQPMILEATVTEPDVYVQHPEPESDAGDAGHQ